jgi:SAM-dependent methyltransferase
MDPKDIVERGYDRIGAEYERWSAKANDPARERYLGVLFDGLPEGAELLDLGCGSGELLTRRLSERFRVTGVELSSRMVELARRNVPGATFVRADMASVEFPPERFDGVCAFYSLTHLPPGELPALLRKVATWLKPGGLFVASMSSGEDPGSVEDDWVGGAPMYFAGHAAEKNEELVEDAGLRVVSARRKAIREEGGSVTFLWVVSGEEAEVGVAMAPSECGALAPIHRSS